MTLTTKQLRARAKFWREKAVEAKWESVSIAQDMLLNAEAFDELAANREAQPVVGGLGEIRVGRLPTMNQEEYPGLGDWWVQLRIGVHNDEILARVYGATPEEAMMRARLLTSPPAPAESLPVAWGGWACQYPGHMPRLYGDKAIAEVNCDFDGGMQLLFLSSAPPAPANAAAWEMRYWNSGHNMWGDWERITAEQHAEMSVQHATDNDYEFRILYDAPPAPAVNTAPDFEAWFNSPEAGIRVVNFHIQHELQLKAWEACRAAMLENIDKPAPQLDSVVTRHANQPVSGGYKLKSPEIQDGWIACSERMPDDEQECLVQTHSGFRYVSFYDEHTGLFYDMPGGNQVAFVEHILVTHWMPLPAAPEGEN